MMPSVKPGVDQPTPLFCQEFDTIASPTSMPNGALLFAVVMAFAAPPPYTTMYQPGCAELEMAYVPPLWMENSWFESIALQRAMRTKL
jgi:hypothetical protein